MIKADISFLVPLKVLSLMSLIFLNLCPTVGAEEYQTHCYRKQNRELISLPDCSVEMTFDHPQNGLDWLFLIEEKTIQHYRNQGTGIEVWSESQNQWLKVKNVDWFSAEEGILCWDNFCANWQDFPLD